VSYGLAKVAGSFSCNLSATNFDAIIQTAMSSAFATNVIKTGTTLNTITIEQFQTDILAGFVYSGCFADKLQIKVPVNGFVTMDATIAGFGMTTESALIGTSYTAPANEQPFTAVTATIKEGGSVIAVVTGIDLSIDNGAVAMDVLGSANPANYTLGMSTVSGTLSAWFTNETLLEKFLNQTPSSIEFTLSDGTNTLDFNMPNVQYTGLKNSVAGQGAIALSLPFVALRDPTTASNIIITRSAV
jgi:hypothetical protein